MSSKSKKMTSRRKCWVPTCRNSTDQGFDKKFFFLPAKLQTRELWIAVSGKPTESIPPEEIVFCEEHFSAQDAVKIGTNSYFNKMVLIPSRNMPDKTCRTCMSIIPFDQSFHIMSSQFPSEMPSSIKDVLCFWISSKPEPLYHIFTFCMPELKIPRDPCQLVCNECFHNIWLFFVYKITCIEVEKDLKGDMSWENYGKKVLCRSCIQTSGTNFIPLSSQSNMGNLLQKMFVNDCPSSETVPLQVCLICFNVLEKLDNFYKNCHEVEEKLKRHIALKNKYNQSSIKQLSSSSVYKSNFSTNIDETVKVGSANGSQINPNFSKNCTVGTSSRDKLTLARLMLKHGHSLKNDLYQQEIWSLICQKMQKQGIGCTVPGLINVWKGMIKETKKKFDKSEPTGYLDELVMGFCKKEPESTEANNSLTLRSSRIFKPSTTICSETSSSSSSSTEASTSGHNQIDLVLKERDNERKKSSLVKKICEENKQKKVIPTEKKSCLVNTSKSDQSSPSDQSRLTWSEEMKLNFIKAFRNEYNNYASQRNFSKISIKKGPWRTICMLLADNSDYQEYEGLFLYRIWTSMKNRAEREKHQADISPGSKVVLALLHKELLVHQTQLPVKITNTNERPELPLLNQMEQNKRINGSSGQGRPKSVVTLARRTAFLKAIVEEYDACDDHEKTGKGPWYRVIKRVVKKLPTWTFGKAYAYWSKLKISAMTHEKGSSDEFDNEVWKLLQRQEEFKKNNTINCQEKNIGSSVDSKEKSASLPNGNHDSKKRLSNETLLGSGKKQKSLPTLFSEEEKLGLVELLKQTYDQMYKEEPSSVYWSAVIKRIFEKGGYKDFTLEEVDTIWNRMIFNASRSKRDGTLTLLDKKINKLVSRASDIQTNNGSLLLIKEVKNLQNYEHTSQLIENDARKSNSSNGSNLSSTGSDIEDETSQIRGWTKDEERVLISEVMKHGDAVLKQAFGDKSWSDIYKVYTDKGYNRSSAAVKAKWYYLRKHAEMTLAEKKTGNEFDKIINAFTKNCLSPMENTGNDILESSMIEDSPQNQEEKGEDELVQYVDLTYNYVSFKDIEKLSEEPILDEPSMKTESSIKSEGNEEVDLETIGHFLLAKVEGGVQFDYEESHQNNETSCAEASSDFEKSTIAGKKNASDNPISENGVLEGNEPENTVEKRTVMPEENIIPVKIENVWTDVINELVKSSKPEDSGSIEIIELLDSDEGEG